MIQHIFHFCTLNIWASSFLVFTRVTKMSLRINSPNQHEKFKCCNCLRKNSFHGRGGRNLDVAKASVQKAVNRVRQPKLKHSRPNQFGNPMFRYISSRRRCGDQRSQESIIAEWKRLPPNEKLLWRARQRVQCQMQREQNSNAAQWGMRQQEETQVSTAWNLGNSDYPIAPELIADYLKTFETKRTGLPKLRQVGDPQVQQYVWISGAWGAEVPLAARLSVAVQNRGGGHHFPGDDRRKWSNHANHGGHIPTARVLQQTPWPLCKGGVEHNGGKQISQPLPQEILHAQIGVESRQGFQHCLFAVHWRTPKVFSFFSSIGGSWGCRITAFQKCGGNNFLEKYIQRFIGYMKDVCNCKPMIVPCYVAVRQCKVRHWAMSYYDSDPWITTSKMMIES